MAGEDVAAADVGRIARKALHHPVGARFLGGKIAYEKHNWSRVAPGVEFAWRSSIAYRMALVAEGRFDATFGMRGASDWDIAAADLVVREVTPERLMAAGDGGTAELLAWFVAMGAAETLGAKKADTVFYVPSVPLRCGMGGVNWRLN